MTHNSLICHNFIFLIHIDTGAQFCVGLKLDTIREVEQKYVEGFEMWCWEDRVRDAVSLRVEYTNFLRKMK